MSIMTGKPVGYCSVSIEYVLSEVLTVHATFILLHRYEAIRSISNRAPFQLN